MTGLVDRLVAARFALIVCVLLLALAPAAFAEGTVYLRWSAQGTPLAVDENRYIAVPDAAGVATLSLPGATDMVIFGKSLAQGALIAVPPGEELPARVTTAAGEQSIDVTVSATPVLVIACDRVNEYAARPGVITVLPPFGEAVSSRVTVKYRGGYSRLFTLKRNYAVHLKTVDGAQEKLPLLQLRRDDDWVLDGALSDPSRLRSRVALDIWNAISGDTAHGAMCELFVSGYYKGVYALNERMDRKTVGVIKSEGFLYRTTSPGRDNANIMDFDGAALPAPDIALDGQTEALWHNVECVYAPPGAAAFSRLAALYDALAAADGAAFAQCAGQWLDLTALADYYLFVNACAGSDNMAKNLFIAFDDAGAGMRLIPWDMDAAFGRRYTAEKSGPAARYGNALYDRLLALPEFELLLRERWAILSPLFTPEAVLARFEGYAAPLRESGAWRREASKNPVYTDVATGLETPFDIDAELAYIKGFMEKRFAVLEGWFGL